MFSSIRTDIPCLHFSIDDFTHHYHAPPGQTYHWEKWGLWCGNLVQGARDNCPKFQGDVETIWLHLSSTCVRWCHISIDFPVSWHCNRMTKRLSQIFFVWFITNPTSKKVTSKPAPICRYCKANPFFNNYEM